MRRAAWFVAIFVLAVAVVVIPLRQLSEPSSPALTFCAVAERQGAACQVADKYDSQVVVVNDGVTKSAYLIVSSGKDIIAVIPLQ